MTPGLSKYLPFALLGLLSLSLYSLSAKDEAASREISFNRDIRPIFSETCFNCHGPDEESREEDLRFDIPESAFAEREGGYFAIVPGDPESSEAWLLINEEDPDYRMPPVDSHLSITDAQKASIKQWIEEGAKYETHWAFVAPEKQAPPQPLQESWIRNDIDRFILSTLEANQQSPNEAANRRTLIRRLSFDLLGLPPKLDEIEAFLNDHSEQAYENLVDRLLASPHYGERMAQAWMDQARYADTNGYSRDGGRSMWLWRDWVIQSYNEDKGYDAFLREQLAGDLIPNATTDQIVATGFNRNHMITAEGGTIPEENLTNYAIDRVKTASEVFLGLTFACAQCHDHKYDPISQKDYFQFYAYFNGLDDKGIDGASGLNARPTLKATTSLKHADIDKIQQRIRQLKTKIETEGAVLQATWETQTRQDLKTLGKRFKSHPLQPAKINSPNISLADSMKVQEDGSLLSLKSIGNFYSIVSKLPNSIRKPVTGVRVEFYPHEQVNEGSLGYGTKDKQGALGVTGVSISKGNLPVADIDINRLVPLADVTASYAHPDYPARNILDPRARDAWSPLGKTQEPQHLTLMLAETVDRRETSHLTVMINFQQIGGPGHFKLFALTGENDESNIPLSIQETLALKAKDRSPVQAEEIAHFHRHENPNLSHLRKELSITKNRLSEMTQAFSTQVMDTAKKPRKTFILHRGSYDSPTIEVQAGTPSFLPSLPKDAPKNRLSLAQWFLDPEHPLTARVAVNRIWQQFFGTGFVSTSADFGSQGEFPSHPELLDWLAVDFAENGWQVKRLIKQIVTSATYRQNSYASPEKRTIDPDNRLLASGPRRRLQAEFIRDSVLQQSGLLNDWIGGSSVKPYQPSNIWRELSHYGSVRDTTQIFVQDSASNLYRRSLYTLWKRTNPPPAMMVFDAPNRESCTVKRESTNTPLQALVLLNDVQFIEASRHLAEHLLEEMPDQPKADRLAYAFELMTARKPLDTETQVLEEAFTEQFAYYRKRPKEAAKLLANGDSPRNHQLDTAEHAAYTTVANLIINLSETITHN